MEGVCSMDWMTFSHRRWFCRWVFKGVQAWAGPVVPLKALANQMVGKPHSAYFSMYLPKIKTERVIHAPRQPWAAGSSELKRCPGVHLGGGRTELWGPGQSDIQGSPFSDMPISQEGDCEGLKLGDSSLCANWDTTGILSRNKNVLFYSPA